MGKLIFLVPGGSIIHYCACAYGCGLYILSNETFCFPPKPCLVHAEISHSF